MLSEYSQVRGVNALPRQLVILTHVRISACELWHANSMRAVLVKAPGGPKELYIGEVAIPEVGPGEVRIKVAAAGVNRADLLQRQGHYPPPKGASEILGLEASGVVDDVGKGVDAFVPGDPVVALLAGGGYAEYVVVPVGQVAAAPAEMGLIAAGGIMETSATVVSNFEHIHVVEGETILIHGGSGGIGSFAIPYAKCLGLRVLTTVGSVEKASHAMSLGADIAIDYHGNWAEEVRRATDGKGVDAILDIIGAKYLEANVSVLARGGRMTVIGLQGGTKGTLDLNALLTKAATITATSLRFRPLSEKTQIVAEVAENVWPLFENGRIPLPPITVFPLEEAAAAHTRLESGENLGKIILTL